MAHPTADQLHAGLATIAQSPRDEGILQLIVRRPASNRRQILQQARLDVSQGLVGDCWLTRGSARTPEGAAHPDMQLNVMNSRVAGLLARDVAGWALSGDQPYIDLDLGVANLRAGALLEIGGQSRGDGPVGRAMRLRGINARVVQTGDVKIGDPVRKLSRV
jgi:hypothetical protein